MQWTEAKKRDRSVIWKFEKKIEGDNSQPFFTKQFLGKLARRRILTRIKNEIVSNHFKSQSFRLRPRNANHSTSAERVEHLLTKKNKSNSSKQVFNEEETVREKENRFTPVTRSNIARRVQDLHWKSFQPVASMKKKRSIVDHIEAQRSRPIYLRLISSVCGGRGGGGSVISKGVYNSPAFNQKRRKVLH